MIVSVLVALSLDGLAIPPPSPEIYGGLDVPPGQLESVVAIEIATGLCSGTLLTEDIVLTAAHCFESMPPLSAVEVVIGHDITEPAATIAAAEYGVHPCAAQGCAQDGFDIAYVRLAEPAPEPSEGYPRPIFDQFEYDDLAALGSMVRVVGFGEDFSGELGRKRWVDVAIDGFRGYGYEFEAGGKGRDSCDGDSGGPALAIGADGRWRIVGVLSRGYTCGQGGIYVVPLPSLCWIEEATGEALVPPTCTGCGCLDLDPDRNDGEGGCRLVSARRADGHWLAAALVLLGAVIVRRRWR